jgi:hypothetical protein
MRLIIPAAGQGHRWGFYWAERKEDEERGWHKHLAEFGGEPIIHRLVRLFQEAGVDDIYVVAQDNGLYEIPGTTLFVPEITGSNGDADKFINSQELWNTGDVYTTPEVVAAIVSDTEPLLFYGRLEESPRTEMGQGWIGLAFDPDEHVRLKLFADLMVFYREHGALTRNGTWELVNAISTHGGIPFGNRYLSAEYLFRNLDDLDDVTQDIDRPAEYEKLKAVLGKE